MKILISESQLRRIIGTKLVEQEGSMSDVMNNIGPLAASGQDYSTKNIAVGAGKILKDAVVNMDPHTRNQILELGAGFIPFVGPAITAGIAAYDASLYHKEGKNKEAGLALVLGLLPGITSVVNKIPAVKQLGVEGMNILADKIAKGITQLSPAESDVVQKFILNKDLIHQETDGFLKRTLNNVVNQTNKNIHPVVHNAVSTVDKLGVGKSAVNKAVQQGVATAYNTAYDAVTRK